MYSKFGFCKFKSLCKRKHYTEECNKQNCQEKMLAKRDILKSARDILWEVAGLKMIVPLNIQARLLSKISVKLNRKLSSWKTSFMI